MMTIKPGEIMAWLSKVWAWLKSALTACGDCATKLKDKVTMANVFTARYELYIECYDGESILHKTFEKPPHTPGKGDTIIAGSANGVNLHATIISKCYDPEQLLSVIGSAVELKYSDCKESGLCTDSIVSALVAGGWTAFKVDKYEFAKGGCADKPGCSGNPCVQEELPLPEGGSGTSNE